MLAAAACAAAPGPLCAQLFGNDTEKELEERNWIEGAIKLPAFPRRGDLVEFDAGSATSFQFFIDGKSLSIGDDGVIRYTLIARSQSGAESVSYEGMRCKTGMYRVYALGHSDGSWRERPSDWKPIDPWKASVWHRSLRREFFCPHNEPIHSVEEGLKALRLGRNPKL